MRPPVGLIALFAARVATPAACMLVVVATLVAGDARAAWLFSGAIIAVLASLRAASFPEAWLTGEGDWLGTAAQTRASLMAAAWLGAALGAIVLAAVAGASIVGKSFATEENAGAMLERSAVAGPTRSLVLMPNESFEQPIGSIGAAGSQVRVRSTVTMGAEAPVTRAVIESGPATATVSVARRTWLTLDLPAGATSVTVTNGADGALALLGPAPFEVWSPSNAWLRGHVRMWGHASAWLVTLVSLALVWGIIMGPGVAALLGLSLWVGAWMWGAGPWLPGGQVWQEALEAVGGGHSPLTPPWSAIGAAAVTLAGTSVIGSAWLRSWRDEVRG